MSSRHEPAGAPIEVLAIHPISARERAMIEVVDAAIVLTDVGGWFDGEIRATWPEFAFTRYLAPDANGAGSRADRDWLLSKAEVNLGGDRGRISAALGMRVVGTRSRRPGDAPVPEGFAAAS